MTKEDIEKTEKVETEKDFLDEKKGKKKDKDEKSLFAKIWNIALWVILFAWMAICLVDYFKVQNDNDPIFCLNKKTTQYEDGEVKSCLGLGYKVYRYKRECYDAIQFGPFWGEDKSVEHCKEAE